jgi:hypothetical protein
MRDYLRALIPLVVAFVVYHRLIVPFIEPQAPDDRITFVPFESKSIEPWWYSRFAADSWQRNNAKVLETGEGVLLFRDWVQDSPDKWSVSPLTILISKSESDLAVGLQDAGPGQANGAAPEQDNASVIVIDNPEGAIIQFKEAFDWTAGKPPPVVGGLLKGAITITQTPSTPNGNDGLNIATHNLRIDRRIIRTTGDVHVEIGQSIVDGRGLNIFLDQDLLGEQATGPASKTPFEGLDRLELNVVERAYVNLPNGGLWTPEKASVESSQTPMTTEVKLPAELDVQCKGAFQFDFHSSIATMTGGVVAEHTVQGHPADEFVADHLRLHFDWGLQPDAIASEDEKWSIGRIEAEGSKTSQLDDPTRWVRINAAGLKTRGQARRMIVDLNAGKIFLSNQLVGQIQTEPNPVFLHRDRLKVWSPELSFISDEIRPRSKSRGNPTQPLVTTNQFNSLGLLDSAGPGRARMQTDTDTWDLSWASHLKLEPDQGEDLLTIVGSANASSEQQGRFTSDSMKMWLKPIDSRLATQFENQKPGRKSPSVLPTRMFAVGNVRIAAPELVAQVEQMQVWFVYPLVETIPVQSSGPSSTADLPIRSDLARSETTAQEQPLTIFSSAGLVPGQISPATSRAIEASRNDRAALQADTPDQPSASRSAASNSFITQQSRTEQIAPRENRDSGLVENPYAIRKIRDERPVTLTGGTLQAKLVYAGNEVIIDDLVINQRVTLTRDSISEKTPIPLTLLGDYLRMNTSDAGNADVQITGNPAKIRVGSGEIVGPEVRFNQRSQEAWIDHPGSFELPVELLSASKLSGGRGKSNSLGRTVGTGSEVQLLGNEQPSSQQWLEPPKIFWDGSMVFDGVAARLGGGVHIEGRLLSDPQTLLHIAADCDELEVQLSDRFNMQPGGSGNPKPALLTLDRNVDLRSVRTDRLGNAISKERMVLPRLEIDLQTTELLGHGSGWLRSRHIANKRTLTGAGDSNSQPVNATQRRELECLHLTFVGQMRGNLDSRQLSFQQQVEALIGPITTWEDSLNVNVQRLSPGQSLLSCDELTLYSTDSISWNQSRDGTSQRSDNWEINASGNVNVDSDSPSAYATLLAHQVFYVANDHLLRIEGLNRTPAKLTILDKVQPNNEPTVLRLTSADLDLETMEPRNIQLQSINGSMGGNAPNRPRGATDPAGKTRYNWARPNDVPSSGPIQSPRDRVNRPGDR